MKKFLHTLLFGLLAIISLFGQTNTWNGNGDGLTWEDPDNWSLLLVPTSAHDVIINTNSYIEISFFAFSNNLNIAHDDAELLITEGASLELSTANSVLNMDGGTIQNYGDLSFLSFDTEFLSNSNIVNQNGATITLLNNAPSLSTRINFAASSSVTNYGTMDFEGVHLSIDILRINGSFTNHGTINISGTGSRMFQLYISGSFINETSGIVNVGRISASSPNSTSINALGDFNNKGLIEIKHPTTMNAIVPGTGITTGIDSPFSNTGTINVVKTESYCLWFNTNFTNAGTMHLEAGTLGYMLGNSPSFPRDLNNQGTLKGSGKIWIQGNLTSGILKPGNSPGILQFSRDQNLSGGYVEFEIEGTAGPGVSGGHDMIEGIRLINNPIHPIVDLDLGDVDIDIYLLGGFQPLFGDEFVIAQTDGELSGQFGIIGFPPLTDPNLYWEVDYDYVEDEVILKVNAFVVPISLYSFEAIEINKDHVLNWTSSREINASHYEIQLSSDGIAWENLAEMQAMGGENNYMDYTYVNEDVAEGEIYFYRLKMIDLDGSYEYSAIRSIRGNDDETFSAYPNPFENSISIESSQGFEIYSSSGRKIYTSKKETELVDLSDYPRGFYLLKLIGHDNSVKKLIKL